MVTLLFQCLCQQNYKTHAILLPVDLMLSVLIKIVDQQHVNVYLNILEILMSHAGQNVWSIQIVHLIRHVRSISAQILVLGHVVLMQHVVLSIMFQPACAL
jgi:hypothetical protein